MNLKVHVMLLSENTEVCKVILMSNTGVKLNKIFNIIIIFQ